MKKSNYKKFLLLWSGEMISSIGGGLTSFGLGVYVFKQTGSAASMALVTLAAFLPTLLLSVPAGVLADKYDRRLLMMLGDGLSAIGLIYILICMYHNNASVTQLILGVSISSIFSSLLEPSYRATITDLLTTDEFSKANGLISLAGSARYLISPLLAGLLLTAFDIKLLLIIDICTFLLTVSVTSIVRKEMGAGRQTEACDTADKDRFIEETYASDNNRFMEEPDASDNNRFMNESDASTENHFMDALKEGWRAVNHNPGVIILIAVSSIITCFMGAFQILAEPMILAFEDSATLGTAETICALGMLVSSILIGAFGIKKNYCKVLSCSLIGAGAAMCLFGSSTNILIICAFGFLFFSMLPFANNCLDYLVRTNIADEYQGRAWGLIGFLSQIGYVVAYGLSGICADVLGHIDNRGVGRGAAAVIIISGILLITSAVVLYQIKPVRALERIEA